MTNRKTKPFFESKMHPGLVMNRFGVVMALKSNPMANSETWVIDWEHVPLKSGLLCVKQDVQEEAYDAGYTWQYVKGERVYSKPAKPKFDKPSLGIEFMYEGKRIRNVQFLHNRGGKVVAFATIDFEDDAETSVMCIAGVKQGDVIDAAKKFLGIAGARS